jgi:hypothetical protein
MIPVIWLNLHPAECHPKDHWDTSIFQELILKDFEEWNGKPEDWPKHAVVMIAGRFHADDLDAINRTIGFLDGCVVVIHSDEESLFPWWEVKHPNMRLWVMTPDPATKRADFVRFIGEGWSPGTEDVTWSHRMSRDSASRPFNVGFAGQVTHPRREQCWDAVWAMEGARWAERTSSFGAGMDRRDYLYKLSDTKFAPCPSGPVTADSFRVYEALEAGCIPILDGIDGKGRDAWGFWNLILGKNHPLPLMKYWADLPELLAARLPRWDTDVRIVRDWWTQRKADWVREMAEDVKAIS